MHKRYCKQKRVKYQLLFIVFWMRHAFCFYWMSIECLLSPEVFAGINTSDTSSNFVHLSLPVCSCIHAELFAAWWFLLVFVRAMSMIFGRGLSLELDNSWMWWVWCKQYRSSLSIFCLDSVVEIINRIDMSITSTKLIDIVDFSSDHICSGGNPFIFAHVLQSVCPRKINGHARCASILDQLLSIYFRG